MKKITAFLLMVLMVFAMMACKAEPAAGTEASAATTVSEATSAGEAASAVTSDENKATYDLKWSMVAAADQPAAVVTQQIIDQIYERSDGRIKITLYAGGVLGNDSENVDLVSNGTVAFMCNGPSIFSSYFDPVQVLSLPYVFKDAEHAYAFYRGEEGYKVFNEYILDATNIRCMSYRYYGFRELTTKGIEVHTPDDLAGIKIRSMDAPVAQFMVSCLGATPVPVAFNELYVALQTGVVSGQENPIANIVANKFYEVQDYVIITNHSMLMTMDCVNEDVWQSFSAEDQQLIMDVLDEYMPISDAAIDAYAAEGIETMEAAGVTVIEPDTTVFRARALQMIEEEYGDNEDWMALLDIIKGLE